MPVSEALFNKDLVNELSNLSGAELNTLLMQVSSERVKTLKPADVLENLLSNRFLETAAVDQKSLTQLDNLIYTALPENYQAIELSPLAPLGSNSVLASIDQKTVIPASRNAEVMADTVTTLALMAAHFRGRNIEGMTNEPVRLATSHRETRGQLFDPKSGFTQHFRGFSLVSAGYENKPDNSLSSETFATEHISDQLNAYLGIIESSKELGYRPQDTTVMISSMRMTNNIIRRGNVDIDRLRRSTQDRNYDLLAEANLDLPRIVDFENFERTIQIAEKHKIDRPLVSLARVAMPVIEDLDKKFPDVHFGLDLSRQAGVGYYDEFCFKITSQAPNGVRYPIVDGGMSDWMKGLMSSNNEYILTGGMGTELYARFFRERNENE